jgi:acetylornithine deacetylase/succinyl-diaminopimelate desuccinylase-like protein
MSRHLPETPDEIRNLAVTKSVEQLDSGAYFESLARRVAIPTESQNPDRASDIVRYFTDEIGPVLTKMGFEVKLEENPVSPGHPFLVASRIEDPLGPTVLLYGHGDVQHAHPEQWRPGLDPWSLRIEGDKVYGRGTADNKGQHSICITALEQTLAVRGRLGYNVKFLLESGEETGSPGLLEFAAANRETLAADLFLGSDGPRISADRPTVFLGSRGTLNFTLRADLRASSHHSGNWGGVLRNPGTVLAAAISSLVDGAGRIKIEAFVPGPIPAAVRTALEDLSVDQGPDSPAVDEGWGEPGLTPIERLIAWNTIEVLAMQTGDPAAPVNAIPATAVAHLQIRFVVGTDVTDFAEKVRDHLAGLGYPFIEVEVAHVMPATRLDPDHPAVRLVLQSIERTLGKKPALLPNLGGSIPNSVFADTLGLPTVWVPHSYPACAQHAPDEHALVSISREGLQIMAGLYSDLADTREVWAPRHP